MTLLSRLEARFGRWAIPNVTMILIAGQVLLYFLHATRAGQGLDLSKIALLPSAVAGGEVWRLVTFLFAPPAMSPLFVLFYWMLMFTFGSSLEQQWGAFRYNVFLGIGTLASIGASFLAYALGYDLVASNGFLYGTIFLAFARLFPDYTINVYFILPIRIKWLALLMWVSYGYLLLKGTGMDRLLIVASVLNYLLFFGREHLLDWKQGHRRRAFHARAKVVTQGVQHQCTVCELNSENSPKTLFRYCSKCAGQRGYCPEHIQNHEHLTDSAPDSAPD